MIDEYFKIAWQSLTRRKLRSWLTMIGIFIGIAAVVSLISLSLGMQEAIVGTFEDLGADKLFISPKSSFGVIGDTGNQPLTSKDIEFLESQTGVSRVAAFTIGSVKVDYQGEIRYFSAAGLLDDSPQQLALSRELIAPDEALEGRPLQIGDGNVVSMGFHHRDRGLYDGKNIKLNDRFLINDQKFTVVEFLAPIGSSSDDQIIYMTMETFEDTTDIKDRMDQIIVEVESTKDPLVVGAQIKRNLARYRGLSEGKEDFQIQTPDDILASFSTVLNIVQAVLIGIALISLMVGCVGITNTMYTSVVERRKEIGIMKAIGAKNKSIFMLFFVESGFLGLVGGILGIILGTIFATLVEVISAQALGKTFLQASYSWELFLGAVLFSFIVGAAAGTFPARQASRLQPVDTLRDE